MNSDFVSRLIDRAPTEAMKQKIAELAAMDLKARYGDAKPEALLNLLVDKIRERSDRKLLSDVKGCLRMALAAGDTEKAEWCKNAIAELTKQPDADSHLDETAKNPQRRK